jgi:myo-inositol-1(or 4)-monophosphatase
MRRSCDDAKSFLKVALAAIEKSDAFINDKVGQSFTTKTKKDGSFVTDIDTGVERLIVQALRNRYPDHDITGEELGSTAKDSDYRWFIDPIDGTLSFKLGLPSYGTILFLCYRSRPIVAVVSQPALRQRYYAVRGGGTYRNDERIRIRDVSAGQVSSELIATGDSYAFKHAHSLGKYRRLLKKHRFVRTIPDCVGHTCAADGTVGAMVDYYLNYWDYAATELLVGEAGGKFTITGSKQLADGRTAYNMICGKPRVVDWLLNEVFG